MFFSVVMDCFGLFVSRHQIAGNFSLVSDVVVGRKFSQKVVFSQSIKVRMFQSINCSQSVRRVHFKKLFQEIKGFWRQFSKVAFVDSFQILNIRKFHSQKPWVLEKGLIVVRSQLSQTFLNKEELIELVLAREHGISIDEFSQNAADSPNINLFGVGSSNQEFGRSVPASGNIVGQLLLVGGFLQEPCKAKITNFKLFFITNEQVLRFDIPMDHILRVHVRQPFQQLIHEQSDNFRLQSIRRFLQHFQEVVLNILKNKINDALLPKSLLELYDVGMLQHFQYFDLAHGCFFNDLVFLGFFELFDSNDLFVLIALAFEDHPVGSFPDHPHYIILLHFNFYHYKPSTINFNLILSFSLTESTYFCFQIRYHHNIQKYDRLFSFTSFQKLAIKNFRRIFPSDVINSEI